MSTDRTRDSVPQGASHGYNLTENLFGNEISGCWVAQSGSWDGEFYSRDGVKRFANETRHHFCCSLMKPGSKSRDKANFAGAILFVLDDVGVVADPGTVSITNSRVSREAVNMLAPDGFYAVETSPGNFQVGWRIEVEHDIARWEHFIRQMSQHKLFGRGVHDVVHYFRMETGCGKPEKGKFQTRLAKPWDGTVWKLDELAKAFGVDMDQAQSLASTRTAPGSSTIPPVSPELGREIIQRLPNRSRDHHFDARNDWIGIAHALRNTCGEAEGRELWLEWNGMRNQVPAGEPERVWDTLPPDSANDLDTLRWWLIKIHGETSKTFATIKQRIADEQAPLTVIEDAPGMPEPKETEAKAAAKKLDDLLKEIAKTQPVPDHHRNGDSANWSKAGKVQTLSDMLKSGTVAPPVIVTPYERGILSVMAGMPGLGKSLLLLNQMLAITYNRPDLIRHGAKLQFVGDIIYISNEDGSGLIKRRAQAWIDHHKLQGVVPPFEIIPMKSTLLNFDGKAWQVACLEILEMVLEYVKGGRDIAMIVVDTLATSVTGIDENTARDTIPVMAFLDRLAKAFWASVAFVHHVNKESVSGEDRSIVAIKGSFSITGAVRSAVTLTPANTKESTDYGWAGRSVVAEYVAKANDDRARYVACYYEQVVVQIATADSVDPKVQVMQETPILLPLVPVQAINDMSQIRAWYDLLVVADRAGKQMRVISSNNAGAKSVHHVLGVPVKKALEIVEKLVAMGVIRIEDLVDTDLNRRVPMVVISGTVSSTDSTVS